MGKVQKEIWKDIAGFEGRYQVSSKSRVRFLGGYSKKYSLRVKGTLALRVRRWIDAKILHVCERSSNGYATVSLSGCNTSLHRVVAKAFIPNPENKPCVNHINGIKMDNRIENLEWVTYSENAVHAFDNGLNPTRKLGPDIVAEIHRLRGRGFTHRAISTLYSVTPEAIGWVLKNKKI